MDLKLTGYASVVRELNKLEPKLRLKILRQGTRAGAKILRDEVKTRLAVHYVSGELEQSVRVRAAKDDRGKRLNPKFEVGHAAETPVFYARFLEFGTKQQSAEEVFARAAIASKPAILRTFKRTVADGVAKIGATSKAKTPPKVK